MRLARGHPEELGIELIDLAEESASAGDDLADLRRVRVVVSVGVPACFGDDARGVGFAAQQVPQGSPRESAPPGRRHPIPTMANGSWLPCSVSMVIFCPITTGTDRGNLFNSTEGR